MDKAIFAALAAALLTGCGLSNDRDRAIAGAATGAIVADLLDENVAAGAAGGAAAGALCDDAGLCY
ncbi:osmotically inducible lipoprotein OsmB [Rhodovulum iodosum]|uniref:Osmotically inducible lipoprotein OsmB n=1 Tax=Rhodovulum iodosum TaxID=68291 RepID=A0ABV3XPN1_9RHOB|nr:hypothetical protein [Rhodovulum robiginosum]RSK31435.1 hypothetical protein EJA01_14950 [Rhodovulum robiginosum]